MRLDKFLCDALGLTRKEATKVLKSGEVTLNGVVQKSGSAKVTEACQVEWQERAIELYGPVTLCCINLRVLSAHMKMDLITPRWFCLMK